MSQLEITAPMPGIFYHRPSPDQAPFVEVGQVISPGDVVGLIEVMKMFQEIHSDVAGVVEAILVDSEDPVAMGQPIISITAS
jgi:acetyl-CoA carboxylase biotin carboxyl carrier protein